METTKFSSHTASVPQARNHVVSSIKDAELQEETLETVELLVSELAANAVSHADTEFLLRVIEKGNAVHVEIEDYNPTIPEPQEFSIHTDGGRGLALVQAFADTWGAVPTKHGKIVWFEVLTSDNSGTLNSA